MVKANHDKKLTQRQELAVRELGKGNGLTAAARAVGVSRQTIHRWLVDPGFVAALNRWRESILTLAQGQILAGLTDAAATVTKAAREGDARIALALLEKTGAFDPIAQGATDASVIARRRKVQNRTERVLVEQSEQYIAEAEAVTAVCRVSSEPPSPAPRASLPPAKQLPPAASLPSPAATSPPKPPGPPQPRNIARESGLGPAVYIPDKQMEAAIAAADAMTKANHKKCLKHLRKAEEQEKARRLLLQSPTPDPEAAQTPTPTEKNPDPTAQINPDELE